MKPKLNVIIPAVTTSLFLVGCGSDDDTVTVPDNSDLLIGEWSVVEIDGEMSGEGVYDVDGYAYEITFEFQADGDFNFCYNYFSQNDPSENYSDCYHGDWEFTDSNQMMLNMTYVDGDTYTLELEIQSITSDRIEGTISSVDDPGDYHIVLEKQ